MKKKNRKHLLMALLSILIYVVVLSVCDSLSANAGIIKLYTAPAGLILSAIAWFCMKKNGKTSYYGFNSLSKLNCKELLYFIPFILLATVNLWTGVAIKNSALEIALFIVSMICVGFLEEVIFRGFLFRAMAENNVKTAIIVSSVTFGIGHIVNLLNGAAFVPTMLQLAYAVVIGFAFTIFVYKTNNIIPCIICHAVLNSLSIFGIEGSYAVQAVVCALMVIIAGVYAIYLNRLKNPSNIIEINMP